MHTKILITKVPVSYMYINLQIWITIIYRRHIFFNTTKNKSSTSPYQSPTKKNLANYNLTSSIPTNQPTRPTRPTNHQPKNQGFGDSNQRLQDPRRCGDPQVWDWRFPNGKKLTMGIGMFTYPIPSMVAWYNLPT